MIVLTAQEMQEIEIANHTYWMCEVMRGQMDACIERGSGIEEAMLVAAEVYTTYQQRLLELGDPSWQAPHYFAYGLYHGRTGPEPE